MLVVMLIVHNTMFNKRVMARSEQRAQARRMDDKTLIRAKNHFNDFLSH